MTNAIHCPQCGEPTDILREGYCDQCRIENQRQIYDFIAAIDDWDRLTPEERESRIYRAMELA